MHSTTIIRKNPTLKRRAFENTSSQLSESAKKKVLKKCQNKTTQILKVRSSTKA